MISSDLWRFRFSEGFRCVWRTFQQDENSSEGFIFILSMKSWHTISFGREEASMLYRFFKEIVAGLPLDYQHPPDCSFVVCHNVHLMWISHQHRDWSWFFFSIFLGNLDRKILIHFHPFSPSTGTSNSLRTNCSRDPLPILWFFLIECDVLGVLN